MKSRFKKVAPKPPKHLRSLTARWFRQVLQEFVLAEHHIKVLTACCEALDRAAQARERIAKDGAYTKNRFGEVTKHPAIGVERDALVTFIRLLRELDLDIDPPAEASRPPALSGIRR